MVYLLDLSPIILYRFLVMKSKRNIFDANTSKEFCYVVFYEYSLRACSLTRKKNVVIKSSSTLFVEASK